MRILVPGKGTGRDDAVDSRESVPPVLLPAESLASIGWPATSTVCVARGSTMDEPVGSSQGSLLMINDGSLRDDDATDAAADQHDEFRTTPLDARFFNIPMQAFTNGGRNSDRAAKIDKLNSKVAITALTKEEEVGGHFYPC